MMPYSLSALVVAGWMATAPLFMPAGALAAATTARKSPAAGNCESQYQRTCGNYG
jgi:hypothetical protein